MDRAVVSPPKSSWLVKFIESFMVVGLVYSAYVLSLLLPKGWKIPPGAFLIKTKSHGGLLILLKDMPC